MISWTDEEIEQQRIEFSKNADSFECKPGDFGYHEALHMCSFLMSSVSKELCEHPAVFNDSENYRLAVKANTELFNLYQILGRKHL